MNPQTIKIIYEDDLLIIVDKPIGYLSHPDKKLHQPDLLSFITNQSPSKSMYAVINRLDFNTSGLVMIGKTIEAVKELNKLANEKQIRKHYLCGVVGYFEWPEATLTAYLLKDANQAVVRISDVELPHSQRIVTKYRVLTEYQGLSLLDIELLTGKTHQIRAHLSHHNHPVLGDPLYGYASINKKLGLKTQALCAFRLRFNPRETTSMFYYLHDQVFETTSIPFLSLFPNYTLE